ncbi:MAG: chemotaxis protein CheD [bacterium]
MNQIIVDIAALEVSANPEDTLVTYSLGSCLGIVVYDPTLRVGGMMHCMLPLSSVDAQKAKDKPSMFVDTGMTILLTRLFEMGVTKKNAVVKVAGGSCVLDKQGLFRIGERNYTIFRKIMWKNGLMIAAEHIGGEVTRTIRLNIGTGLLTIKIDGQEYEL